MIQGKCIRPVELVRSVMRVNFADLTVKKPGIRVMFNRVSLLEQTTYFITTCL